MATIERDVNLMTMKKPMYVSLVGNPANQVAFRVVRDDEGNEKRVPHIRRSRKQRADGLLSIIFEEDIEREDILDALAGYGVVECELETLDDGKTKAVIKRNEEAQVLRIDIGNGRVAEVMKPISNAEGKPFLAVSRVDFDADIFETKEEAHAWLDAHGVERGDAKTEVTDTHVQLIRVEITENEETRRLRIEPGVHFVISRADEQDIPAAYIAVVNEEMYGNWGWGQLDFAAAYADIQFSELAENAVWVFRDVLYRILFYSELPLDARKALIERAAMQLVEFLSTLLGSLPTAVILATREDKPDMTKKTETQDATTDAKRDDEQDAKKTEAASQEQEAGTEQKDTQAETVTRADVEAMLKDAMGGIAGDLAGIKRALAAAVTPEGEGKEAKEADGGEDKKNAEGEGIEAILRSINTLAEAVKATDDRLRNMEDSTVVRSDSDDPKTDDKEPKDVFAGVFGAH